MKKIKISSMLIILAVFLLAFIGINVIAVNFVSPINGTIQKENSLIVNLTTSLLGEISSFVDFDSSLISWWRFEGNVNDEMGINNGVQTGYGLQVPGVFGNATDFNGDNQYINLVNTNSLKLGNNHSIAGWIYIKDNSTAGVIIAKWCGICGYNDVSEARSYVVDVELGKLYYGISTQSFQLVNSFHNFYSNVTLPLNKWIFFTVTYNGTRRIMYINGTFEGYVDKPGDIYQSDADVQIGANRDSGYRSFFNGSMDEIMMFGRTLSASEVATLYNSTANKYYNNFTGLSEGTHTLVGYEINSSGTKNQTSIWTIRTDYTSPNASNIFFYPNSSEVLDPNINITINATITDTVAMGLAIVEVYNGTGWTNYSMRNSSNVYTANLTLDLLESNYTYRIWANDSVGNPSRSSNRTFTALWDCSWNATQDLGAVAGFNQNKFIGNITINNTGDVQYSNNNCSLNFHFAHNLGSNKIYFNDSENSGMLGYYDILLGIPAKTSLNLKVNASFGGNTQQENLIINTSEFSSRSTLASTTTTAVLVTNQIGPYLYNKITYAPTQIYLTPGNFSLEGYLRNLMGSTAPNESNTAYNVSFYWSMPSGLTNISDNLTMEYVNITDSSLNTLNVNITFTDTSSLASMTSGTKTIYLYALGYNLSGARIPDASGSTLITSSTNITFQCYSTSDGVYVTACGTLDGDYVTLTTSSSSSGGGGGGGSGATGEQAEPFSKFIKQENFELVRGEEKEFIIEFTNPYLYGELQNLTISLSGIDSQYIKITPNKIDRLNQSKTISIKIKINAPKYLEEGNYKLTLEINGDLLANDNKQSFLARKKIDLFIFEISRKDITAELENAKALIEEMKSNNLSYLPMESLLNDAEIFLNLSAMGKANSKYLELKKIHDDAFSSKEILSQLNAKILEAQANGINTPETSKLVSLAEAAFARGDYALSLARLKEAQLSYALEVKGEFNTAYYVKNHPFQSLGFLIAVCFIAIASTLTTRKILLNSKLKLLAEEEKLLVGLMKVVQRECFEEKRMSMEEYENTMSQYENRLNVVIQDKIEAETKIANLMKIRGGKRKVLREESIRLKELIKETQRQYFDKSQMETRVYQNMIKSYAAKLSEIEENLATIEAQDELRKRGLKL